MKFFRTTIVALLAAMLAGTAAAQQPGETTVILVRHAEKAAPASAMDGDPALSPAGEQRARDLEALLRGRHVDAIVTTQFKRTRMTAQPLADSLHLVPEVVQAGAPDHVAAVAELIRTRHAGQTVLVVGHSNTVTAIIAALGGPALGDLCDSAYGNLFTLVIPASGAPRLNHAHYGAADPPAAGCENGIQSAHPPHP
ncbi:phosphoglycerate mutase family protein [Longimicrobium sp.]|uniref:phosphoglycerate mutase family protein n=1 Tax=Longimicrobium sp. TaxID=2029185 RepID=UPI002B611461|nr:phosphoglycerate mutase family protein [Longimicrobium sp.]HSU16763.1 phosphoglycerate mutase family protein [Longimicrobium sp.]